MSASVDSGAAGLGAGGPAPLWRHRAFLGVLGASALAALALPLWWAPLAEGLTALEFAIADVVPRDAIAGASWFLLPAIGLGVGILASLSPCVLPLVPLNVAYIGAADATGARAAALSGRFVLGAALALAALGLAADTAGFLLIEQRGPVLLAVGGLLVYFGVAALDLAPVPFAGRAMGGTSPLGPVGAGATFALLTSPCQSPLLGGVLAASATQGVAGLSVASMLGFAVGYTLLVFLAGVFGSGLVARLRRRSFEAPRAAAAAILIVVGAGFVAAGAAWF